VSLSKSPQSTQNNPLADDGSDSSNVMGHRVLRRGLLFFWGAWTGMVVVTNLADGLKTLGILSDSWPLASGNYALLARVTAIYQTPRWFPALLFCGVILWEAAAAALFLRAALIFQPSARTTPVVQAFALSLGLWMAFMLADETFLAYRIENTHRSIFIAQLLTLLAVWLLRD
jgi:hypothetical protein